MADEIVKNLFLGDWMDAMKWHSELSETVPSPVGRLCLNKVVDVLDAVEPNGNGHVKTATLDTLADVIDVYLKSGCKVLVHCRGGMERSPLTIAWYLMRYKNMSIHEAYDLLQSKRHVVLRKLNWVPQKYL
jgi:protein-tyrosine phosphatase